MTKTYVPPPKDRYHVFISYKRRDGSEIARIIADKLAERGYHVFLDVEKLGSGRWDQELQDRIDQCPDFVTIVTDAYFSGCENAEDIVRQEIGRALSQGKNVVPLLASRQSTDFPENLPASIERIRFMNGVRWVHDYADGAVAKLCGFLTARPSGGPQALRQGDAQARVIVSCIGFALGAWQGASNGAMAGPGGWSLIAALFNGLFWGVMFTVGIAIPLFFLLGFLSDRLRLRRDEVYLGPWLPFWAIYIPLTMILASTVPVALFNSLGLHGYFWGGILGGLAAFGLTALFSFTDIWLLIATSLGLRSASGTRSLALRAAAQRLVRREDRRRNKCRLSLRESAATFAERKATTRQSLIRP